MVSARLPQSVARAGYRSLDWRAIGSITTAELGFLVCLTTGAQVLAAIGAAFVLGMTSFMLPMVPAAAREALLRFSMSRRPLDPCARAIPRGERVRFRGRVSAIRDGETEAFNLIGGAFDITLTSGEHVHVEMRPRGLVALSGARSFGLRHGDAVEISGTIDWIPAPAGESGGLRGARLDAVVLGTADDPILLRPLGPWSC